MDSVQFSHLRLAEPILRALGAEGYTQPTPIQAQAIPRVLEGRDVLGCAQTGTGKTAAFAAPILHRLSAAPALSPGNQGRPRVRCLVLCPTRELATQIADGFRAYGKNLAVRLGVVFGGVGQNPQVQALRRGVEVIVATPGRLMDLIEQGHADLRGVETLVLDEADRMLDMGFIQDIRKIVARLPANRQTLMFSATMPTEIRRLADALLRNPVTVQVTTAASTAENIDESVYFVEKSNKPALLAHLVGHLPMTRAIVFTRTKHGADRVVRHLHQRGIRAEAIHGNKSQNARERALVNFKSNRTPVLVATDIASRGIDIDGITHVVNYDLTHEPETYIHRIGRTARAGASGNAVSFCDREELPNLRAIEKLIRRPIPVRKDHPEASAASTATAAAAARDPKPVHSHSSRPSRSAAPEHKPAPAKHPLHGRRGADRPRAAAGGGHAPKPYGKAARSGRGGFASFGSRRRGPARRRAAW